MKFRMWWQERRAGPPARRWFRAEDGSYYRNCPLIKSERDAVMAWPMLTPGKFEVLDALHAEWAEMFAEGVQRKAALGPGDVVAEPASFREAYPRHPGLWVLDEEVPGGAVRVV